MFAGGVRQEVVLEFLCPVHEAHDQQVGMLRLTFFFLCPTLSKEKVTLCYTFQPKLRTQSRVEPSVNF